ncbi:MAG: hypothetical protein R3207_06680, partial [Oceanospirillum sp.]|nr:hypothetical protein [Oceanospirillum sp.]
EITNVYVRSISTNQLILFGVPASLKTFLSSTPLWEGALSELPVPERQSIKNQEHVFYTKSITLHPHKTSAPHLSKPPDFRLKKAPPENIN